MSSTTAIRPSVSVIGSGLMGSALARTFIRNDFKTTVWNRSPEKATPLTNEGATLAESVAACVKSSSLTIVCLSNSSAFKAALTSTEFDTRDHERILVDFTTGSPSQIRNSLSLSRRLGFSAYIHGAILAFPRHVGLPEATIFYSGDFKAFETVRTDLSVLGTPVYIDDDAISSALQEVLLVSSAYSSWVGFLQSMALLRTFKGFKTGSASAQDFVNTYIEPRMLDSLVNFKIMAKEIDEQDYRTKGDGATCSLHLSSLKNFAQTFREQGLSTEILDPIINLVERRVAQGRGDDELSSLVEVISEHAGK